MESTTCTISYGTTIINYELLITNRKSLEIAVHPDKSVVVKAPKSSSIQKIEEKIRKRARWIKKQISYFNQFEPKTPEGQYIGGEGHLYLGRKYRLKIEKSYRDKISLRNGYFYIECSNDGPAWIKNLLDTWYKQKAKKYVSKVFDDCWMVFNNKGFKKPTLKLQKMEKRWGSLSQRGQLTLNLSLIQTPRECIEYVIIHELCHLAHHNHGPEFYKLLNRIMLDWMKRKHKLEMSLI